MKARIHPAHSSCFSMGGSLRPSAHPNLRSTNFFNNDIILQPVIPVVNGCQITHLYLARLLTAPQLIGMVQMYPAEPQGCLPCCTDQPEQNCSYRQSSMPMHFFGVATYKIKKANKSEQLNFPSLLFWDLVVFLYHSLILTLLDYH